MLRVQDTELTYHCRHKCENFCLCYISAGNWLPRYRLCHKIRAGAAPHPPDECRSTACSAKLCDGAVRPRGSAAGWLPRVLGILCKAIRSGWQYCLPTEQRKHAPVVFPVVFSRTPEKLPAVHGSEVKQASCAPMVTVARARGCLAARSLPSVP